MLLQRRIAGGRDQVEMEFAGEPDVPRRVADPVGLALFGDLPAQGVEPAMRRAPGKHAQDARFEDAAQLVDIAGLLDGGSRHESTAVGNEVQQLLGRQPAQDLAHGAARDAEDAAELDLGQLGSRRQPMLVDRVGKLPAHPRFAVLVGDGREARTPGDAGRRQQRGGGRLSSDRAHDGVVLCTQLPHSQPFC